MDIGCKKVRVNQTNTLYKILKIYKTEEKIAGFYFNQTQKILLRV